jgi:hypothetical protein
VLLLFGLTMLLLAYLGRRRMANAPPVKPSSEVPPPRPRGH